MQYYQSAQGQSLCRRGLSKHAVGSAGSLHKEIRSALDVADRPPEGQIYLIPLKLEECDVPAAPFQISMGQSIQSGRFWLLMRGLRVRAEHCEHPIDGAAEPSLASGLNSIGPTA